MECVKAAVLRSYHILICDNIDLETTTILDELYESEVITLYEIEDIKLKQKKREQVATLLDILRRTDPKLEPFESFTKAITKPYWFIVPKLQQTLYTESSKHTKCHICEACIRCVFLENLDPTQVLDILYQEKIICYDNKEEINNKPTRMLRAKKFLKILSLTKNPRKSFRVFLDHLPFKYNFLKRKLDNANIEDLRKCYCKKTKDGNAVDGENRGDKRVFKFRESAVYTCNIVQVKKCLPFSYCQVNQLGKLWNELWHCREEGCWQKLEYITRNYFEMYSDNPDVMALLYRSEMGTWAFYRNDYDKACICFTHAMELLPFTKMNSWHMGRILAIKIAMCVKQGQYEDAYSALVKARQSTALLAPCLATGTVNVFEGLYLSSLIIHGSRGSDSSSFKERAKLCFLSAIQDYQGETSFEIQSFSSEIYLFLAMLDLGIDFRQIDGNFIERKKSHQSENSMFSEVQRNLDYFKSKCWDVATNWSKMLFYIVTAEQQMVRTQFEVAKKSLNYACRWGEKGKFENQLSYIRNNIEIVEAKLEAEKMVKHYSEDNSGDMDIQCPKKKMCLIRNSDEDEVQYLLRKT